MNFEYHEMFNTITRTTVVGNKYPTNVAENCTAIEVMGMCLKRFVIYQLSIARLYMCFIFRN